LKLPKFACHAKIVKLVLSKIFAASSLALGNRQSRKPSRFPSFATSTLSEFFLSIGRFLTRPSNFPKGRLAAAFCFARAQTAKIFHKNFQKTIDKTAIMWYNKYTKGKEMKKMTTTFLIITLIAGILSIITKVLSYIFDVVDDFRPFTTIWYNASGACEAISEFLFMGSILSLIVATIIYLIGG
jgi:hypothetical protein